MKDPCYLLSPPGDDNCQDSYPDKEQIELLSLRVKLRKRLGSFDWVDTFLRKLNVEQARKLANSRETLT